MELSLSSLKKSISHFLFRFHVMIFTIIILGGLSIAVFFLSSAIDLNNRSQDYAPSSANATFDEQTITRVRELHENSINPKPIDLPAGRIDPFAQ